MDEKIITWNLPNLVSIWLMIVLLWFGVGFASHLLVRKPAAAKAAASSGFPTGAA